MLLLEFSPRALGHVLPVVLRKDFALLKKTWHQHLGLASLRY